MNTPLARREFLLAAAATAAATGLATETAQAQSSSAQSSSAPAQSSDPTQPGASAYPAPKGERSLRIGSLLELEQEAAEVIPPGAFAYIASGSDNQWTLHENRLAFDRHALRPHYLVGKPAPDLRTKLLGQEISMPIITAPMGAHGLAHVSAEEGTARGTGEAGTLMTASTAANKTIEAIAAATSGPKWFQLYLHDDRGPSRELLQRAKAAGYSAVVFTIDAFAPGSSDETVRLGFSFPPDLPLVNSKTALFKKSLSWDDVTFIQQTTDLPLILKGVVTPEMARMALERGIAGIQVSNHGGRQLDGVPAALDALPPVVEAVRGRVPVIMDSGIRRGTDVFKALALGADAVALGRPVLYGLALGGWMGVKSVYDRIQDELTRTMLIAGTATVKEVQKDFLFY
jgi:isopentenyl diphosphate isomerase/L-lactate dehydrogenase-like FMN-dependent dehydrogenase